MTPPRMGQLLPIVLARRHQRRPVVRWVSALQHALKNDIGVAFAAGGAQGVFIIHPRENNDPGFRVEPKKQPESTTHFFFLPVAKRRAHPVALPILLAMRITRHDLENQFRQCREQPDIGVGLETPRILPLRPLSGSTQFLELFN